MTKRRIDRLFKAMRPARAAPKVELSPNDHQLLREHGTSFYKLINEQNGLVLIHQDKDALDDATADRLQSLLNRINPVRRKNLGAVDDLRVVRIIRSIINKDS